MQALPARVAVRASLSCRNATSTSVTGHASMARTAPRFRCRSYATPQGSAVHPMAQSSRPGGSSSSAGRQSWSTVTALSLATLTGAITYIIGAKSNAIQADASSMDTYQGDKSIRGYTPPTMADFEKAIEELRASLPEECFSTDREELVSHGSSTWTYHNPEILPGAVLYPRHTEDVVAMTKAAYKYGIPMVAVSGGTSLEGHFDAPSYKKAEKETEKTNKIPLDQLKPGPSFAIDFGANMNEIVELHERDLDVVVQPGMPYELLNEELAKYKLLFPVDPGPGAEVGGMVGTGCSGTNAVRYGTMRENVLNLTVVLPNGEVIKTRSRARKSSAGPDLTKLFIGSEGTLGLVVEATLKLAPKLPTSVAVASFPDLEAAADTVRDVVQNGVMVQCIEILDDIMMKAINKAEATTKGAKQWPEKPSLFFKFNGSEEQIQLDMKRTADIVKRNKGTKLVTATSEKEQEDLWRARKVALWSAMEYLPGSRCWTTDVCVPISKFPELVAETKRDLDRLGVFGPIVGHAGDGNFHGLLLFRDDEELERVKEGVHNMVELAQKLDGTCTGEHGVGHGKMQYLANELGSGTVDLLRRIKREIDTKNIMNPGKLVDYDAVDS